MRHTAEKMDPMIFDHELRMCWLSRPRLVAQVFNPRNARQPNTAVQVGSAEQSGSQPAGKPALRRESDPFHHFAIS